MRAIQNLPQNLLFVENVLETDLTAQTGASSVIVK